MERRVVSNWLALGVGAAFLAIIVAGSVGVTRRHGSKNQGMLPKVTVGAKDSVYYSSAATAEDAIALGRALQGTGFLRDSGTSVLLAKGRGPAVVSFVVVDGAWEHANTVEGFEEIGRRVALSIGGFPIQVHLVDSSWNVRKSLAVGKAIIGSRDSVYYFGSATEGEANAVGQTLRDAGYMRDLGASAVLSKGGGTSIGFVVGEGVWDRPESVAGFVLLAGRVARSVGGLPVRVRLLNTEMETKKEVSLP